MSILALLYRLYLLLFFAPIMLAYSLLTLVVVCITCLFNQNLAFTLWLRLWGRVFCSLTPVRVDSSGSEHLDPQQSYVIVANHASQYDIPIVCGWLLLDIKWVAKMELKNHPIIGTAGKAVGAVFVDRENRNAAIANLEVIKSQLVNGTSVIFFPEGTRSKIGKMMPFKRGAFVMAKELNLPILPVSIINSDKILSSGTIFPKAGKAEVRIHAPITAAQVAELDLAELTNKARAIVASAIASEQ